MPRRRKHSTERKTKIVLDILSGNLSVAEASREHQIKDSLIYRWRTEFLEAGAQGLDGGEAAQLKRLAERNAQLERLVGKLTLQLELSKKATPYAKALSLESEPL